MGNRQGILTYADASQFQATVYTDKLAEMETAYGISFNEVFRQRLSDIFASGSYKRSCFFMPFRLGNEFTRKNVGAYVPVCGVKGQPTDIKRDTRYVQIFLCDKEEIKGSRFQKAVFETDYIRDKETTSMTKSELLAQFDRQRSITVNDQTRKKALLVLEKIWIAKERDPKTRIVIMMNHAEKESMELLSAIYRVLPEKLRLDLGFMTNATEGDLDLIEKYNGLPLYLFTMDSSEKIIKDHTYPIEIVNSEELVNGKLSESRAKLLQDVSDKINEKSAFYLDYVETSVLEKKQTNAASFKYYEEILRQFLSEEGFWWDTAEVNTIEELQRRFETTRSLMAFPEYKAMVYDSVEQRFFVGGSLYQDLIRVVNDGRNPKRETLLRFVTQEFSKTSLINAILDNNKMMKEFYSGKIEKIDGDKKAVEVQLQQTKSELTRAVQEKNELASKLEAERNKDSGDWREESRRRMELENSHRKELDKQKKKYEDIIAHVKKGSRLFLILSIILGLGMAASLTLFFIKNGQVSKIEAELAKKDEEYLSLTAVSNGLNTKNNELEHELKTLKLEHASEDILRKKEEAEKARDEAIRQKESASILFDEVKSVKDNGDVETAIEKAKEAKRAADNAKNEADKAEVAYKRVEETAELLRNDAKNASDQVTDETIREYEKAAKDAWVNARTAYQDAESIANEAKEYAAKNDESTESSKDSARSPDNSVYEDVTGKTIDQIKAYVVSLKNSSETERVNAQTYKENYLVQKEGNPEEANVSLENAKKAVATVDEASKYAENALNILKDKVQTASQNQLPLLDENGNSLSADDINAISSEAESIVEDVRRILDESNTILKELEPGS